MASKSFKRIAFVGNPNAGKTTLFNSLTGSRQKVGNYAGVTVERVSALRQVGTFDCEFIDVPGLYSLTPASEDEAVAVRVLEEETDLVVCVIDASNLERNLFLYSQIAELLRPVVVALTMTDRVESAGSMLKLDRLRRLLGCPVIPMVGHKEKGVKELLAAIEASLAAPAEPTLLSDIGALRELQVELARRGYDHRIGDLRREVLDDQSTMIVPFAELRPAWEKAKEAAENATFTDPSTRYAWTAQVQREAIVQSAPKKVLSLTDRIDKVLTHRVFGLMVFAAVMYCVFFAIYTLSQPFMGLIEGGFGWLGSILSPRLESIPVLQSFVVDGLIAGVGGVVVFLPQILILFFFIAMLEGTGYLARAAFLMDRLLGWCGLNGRAFIPLLSSFACAIPGVMAARVMPDPKARLATILVAPLMSCSARLPVYMLIIGSFIEPQYGAFWAGFALFAMHLLGLVVAIPVVFILNRGVLKGKRLPFMLELPPYQMPRWKDVFLGMLNRGKVFLTTAGTTIVVMSVIIWAASYFPRKVDTGLAESDAALAQLEYSVMGRVGKAVEPVFAPLGFDWRISTAILSAFPARETVVPSLGILFSLGSGDEAEAKLGEKIKEAKWPDGKKLFTLPTSIGLMVFFALCAQCLSTLAVVRRETNSRKWPLFMFTYMTVLAYLGAWFVQWIGRVLAS
ncbi:MAG: ferrous iron transport protein B [Fimbriimonas sp.]|nr:ferrous iron transport protein B [Fimbriimonas sp.]